MDVHTKVRSERLTIENRTERRARNMEQFRRKVWEIISGKKEAGTAGKVFRWLILVLILLSVGALLLDSFNGVHERYHHVFVAIEIVAVAVFTLEYLAGLWTADLTYPDSPHPRLRYLFSFMAIIELLAIFPFYLSLITNDRRIMELMPFFELLRLLHLFKLSEYFHPLHVLGKAFRKGWRHILLGAGVCLTVLVTAGMVFYTAEGRLRPELFPNIFTCIWNSLASMNGLLAEPVHPLTGLGRLMAGLMQIAAIGAIAVPAGMMVSEYNLERHREEAEGMDFCPHCGKKLR